MRVRTVIVTIGVAAALIVWSCNKRSTVATGTSGELRAGNCAGCLLEAKDDVFSFVVRNEAEYDSLTNHCFFERIREEWLPPKPKSGEELVYVSLEGGGCGGCLDIVSVGETSGEIVVGVEGGFRGECDMLMVLGAWVLIPGTDRPVTVEFYEVVCGDDR